MFIPPPILRTTRWALDTLIAKRDRRKEFIRVYGRDGGLYEFELHARPEDVARAREIVREIQQAAAKRDLTFRDVALAAQPAE